MPRESQYDSEQLRQPIPIRTWDRTSEGDRYQQASHVLHRVAEDVSPVSAASRDEIAPSVPAKSFSRSGPHASSIYTRAGFAEHQPQVVLQVPAIKRKPVRATTQPLPAPLSTENLGIHDDMSNEQQHPPQPSNNKSSRWPQLIGNVSFLFIPVLFLTLGLVLGSLDGKPTNERRHWNTYQNLMQIAATLFPITFALITGRAAVKVAAYILQNGTTLGKLEQMMGSKTISGTIGTQFQLRSFNALGLCLILLWLLSPIGSQAYLRLVSPGLDSRTSPSLVPYFTTDTQSMFAGGDSISSDLVQSSVFRSMFAAALLSPSDSKTGPMDLWGNVKIPSLSSLQPITGGDWVTLSPNDSVVYSSLVGIPIAASGIGTTDLSIESSYINLNCGTPNRMSGFMNLQPFYHDSNPNSSPYSVDNGTCRGIDSSVASSVYNTTATWSIGLDSFVSPHFNGNLSTKSSSKSCQPGSQGYIASPCSLRNLSPAEVRRGTLLFQSLQVAPDERSTSPRVDAAFCQLNQVYVESQVTCTTTATTPRVCRVVAQRNSQGHHAPSALTPLSFPEIFQAMSLHLPRSFGTEESSSRSDPSIYYISNPSPAAITTATGPVDLSHTQPQILSHHLGQIINTYYTLSQAYQLITEGSPQQLPDNPTAISTIRFSEELYQVAWPWFVFLIISILAMLLSGLATVILSLQIRNPDILGYCSSLIRDSKYIDLPIEGGNDDGMKRTRMNSDLRLTMGEVRDAENSHIAIVKEEDMVSTRKDGRV
ncbi:uncharacterized protein BP5553_04328 [Venustampulla echinocandica]|uniref:Uncharacterized protein n=1 Tax=Venustampulla echinocandica TaxID=2656787 RepID=A0A370TWY4_9HELO|nr:uncharacterized protein BP5553_04328 [Venustampulla echinocandica]RDL39988.1 hypothetical protein BP5553_04328 [Venustampulla echinocandica]